MGLRQVNLKFNSFANFGKIQALENHDDSDDENCFKSSLNDLNKVCQNVF